MNRFKNRLLITLLAMILITPSTAKLNNNYNKEVYALGSVEEDIINSGEYNDNDDDYEDPERNRPDGEISSEAAVEDTTPQPQKPSTQPHQPQPKPSNPNTQSNTPSQPNTANQNIQPEISTPQNNQQDVQEPKLPDYGVNQITPSKSADKAEINRGLTGIDLNETNPEKRKKEVNSLIQQYISNSTSSQRRQIIETDLDRVISQGWLYGMKKSEIEGLLGPNSNGNTMSKLSMVDKLGGALGLNLDDLRNRLNKQLYAEEQKTLTLNDVSRSNSVNTGSWKLEEYTPETITSFYNSYNQNDLYKDVYQQYNNKNAIDPSKRQFSKYGEFDNADVFNNGTITDTSEIMRGYYTSLDYGVYNIDGKRIDVSKIKINDAGVKRPLPLKTYTYKEVKFPTFIYAIIVALFLAAITIIITTGKQLNKKLIIARRREEILSVNQTNISYDDFDSDKYNIDL